jgi:hypothetical protein
MAAEPATLQLRFLQTLSEVAAEKNSTIVFPVPVDLLSLVLGSSTNGAGGDGGRPRVRVGGGGGTEPPGPDTGASSREGTVS